MGDTAEDLKEVKVTWVCMAELAPERLRLLLLSPGHLKVVGRDWKVPKSFSGKKCIPNAWQRGDCWMNGSLAIFLRIFFRFTQDGADEPILRMGIKP